MPDLRQFRLLHALFFPLFFPLFFSLFSIVLARADFLKPAQSLALYLACIFDCKSPVFFRKNFPSAGPAMAGLITPALPRS
jgi:hypothetical protein